MEPELHGVGDGHHLQRAALGEALNALAHGGLAQTDRPTDLRVRSASVFLQLFDDPLREPVDRTGE